VQADHTISVTFAVHAYTITPSAGAHGSISPSTPQSVAYGGSATFTFKASNGYYVDDVKIDGVSQGPMPAYTFTDVAADHTVAATFLSGIQTSLTISLDNSLVTYGRSTVVRGRLMDAVAQVGLGGEDYTVFVEAAASPIGPWDAVGEVYPSTVGGQVGQLALKVQPTAPTYYRVRYVAAPLSPYGGSTSRVVRVSTRPYLSRPVPPRSVKARRAFTVSGTLKPQATAGTKTVKVKIYRYRRGHWRLVKSVWATNVNSGDFSKYRLRMRLARRAKYRFRATSTPSGWSPTTTGRSRTLVVR